MFSDLFDDKPKPVNPDKAIENALAELPDNHIAQDLLRAIYRCRSLPWRERQRAAREMLPYDGPKLQMVAQINESSFAALLDKAIERTERLRLARNEPKLIEAKPNNDGGVDVRLPPKSIPDRRFRRI